MNEDTLIAKIPQISVIMGIYNCAQTLDEAIESIIMQTYTDWELIMCDDASTDDTYDVARKYCEKNPYKFKLLKNEYNQGLNITLNRCLKEAKGKYIARMDGDDISVSTRLEKETAFLDAHPEYGLVSCLMIRFDETGELARCGAKERPQIPDLLSGGGAFGHAPCMIRKEVYDAVGGYTVDKRLIRAEDTNLWHKIYSKGYRGYNLQEYLYMVRDDMNAAKRRTLRTRLHGTYAIYIGCKLLRLPPLFYLYVAKHFIMSVVKCSMPKSIYRYFHKIKLNNKR